MTRYYEMSVEVTKHNTERRDAIQEVARREWPFDDWREQGETLKASAAGSLCCGESDSQFADRLALAIWKANGAYCDVTVKTAHLESLPCEEYRPGDDDYAQLIGQQQEQHDANGSGR
ncbi:MAG: hypothetical protein ACLQNE_22340 [Thermoguttaceae bacterium]